MCILIRNGIGLSLSSGLFDIITESTRENFSSLDSDCILEIYKYNDEQCQGFIALNDVDIDCFNLFYQHCETAMKGFLESPRGKIPPPNYIPGILWHFEEVLRLMREDPRFDVKLCYPVKSDDQS